ncbi:MAG: sugar phosphate isomerase/epimerase [Lachnospiraceae bacterium]|nr:sugar phosphate isomerase/epimerase [Lachnospiraceae bacterium]
MKLGFNEANSKGCAGHSLMKDLEFCEKYGFDLIDIQSECLDRDLESGAVTLEQVGEFFKTHHIKMASYNALQFFNMKKTQAEKDEVLDKLREIVRRCKILGCGMIVVVPTCDLDVPATISEIRKDTVEVIKSMLPIVEPEGIKLSIEFCASPAMTINRFDEAYAIIKEVNHPLVGLTCDEYHFRNMGSTWEALENADGSKVFVWHLNGCEEMPLGASYNTDAVRLWPDDEKDCLDHKRLADTFKKIGYAGDNCIIEIFRPEYWGMDQEENVKKSFEVTKAHVEKYWK